MRNRNAVLEAIELLREARPGMNLAQIIAFLHVADEDEDDVLPLGDLQHRADLSPVQAWRTARALAEPVAGDSLVRLARWKTGAALALSLSAEGESLRTRIDGILRRAEPIAPRSGQMAAE